MAHRNYTSWLHNWSSQTPAQQCGYDNPQKQEVSSCRMTCNQGHIAVKSFLGNVALVILQHFSFCSFLSPDVLASAHSLSRKTLEILLSGDPHIAPNPGFSLNHSARHVRRSFATGLRVYLQQHGTAIGGDCRSSRSKAVT